MECPHCFYLDAQTVDERHCAVCGRSYRPAVNVYLGLVALVYLVLMRYASSNLTLSGEFFNFRVRPQPPWDIFAWARTPVDIVDRPSWIFVLALIMAVMVLTPIVMSLLYGKRGGALLLVIAFLTAPSGLLSLVMIPSVWIAGGWTLRLQHKTLSAILACLPPWAFLIIFSRPTVEVPLPAAYFVPAVLAVLIDLVIIFALFLPLRLFHWNARLAGVALCAFCVAPMGAYKLAVGEDELQYYRLARTVGLESRLYEDIPGAELDKKFQERARREVDQRRKADEEKRAAQERQGLPPIPVQEESYTADLQGLVNRYKAEWQAELQIKLDAARTDIPLRCRAFLDRFPNSRHVPEVLYTMSRAIDMDVDTSVLRETPASSKPIHFDAGRISRDPRFTDESRQLCHKLLQWFPESAYAAVAMVKLAEFEAAHAGRIDEAVRLYNRVVEAYAKEVDAPLPDLARLSVFTDLFTVGGKLRGHTRALIIDEEFRIAQRERAFLVENRDCPRCGNQLLADYLALPPFELPQAKRAALRALLTRCPDGKLADNAAFDLALLEPDVQSRLAALAAVKDRYRGTDGAAAALFNLADLKTKLESNRFRNMKEAIDLYQEFLRQYPASYLAPSVDNRIRALENAVLRTSADTDRSRAKG